MIKRLIFAFLGVLFLSIAVSAFQGASQSKTEKRTVKYVIEVLDKVQKYHPEGKNYKKAEFIESAKNLIIRYLKKQDIKEVPKKKLLDFLSARKFNSVTQLMHLLDRYSQTVVKLDMVKIADIAANGVIQTTHDPFSQVLTMEQVQKMQQMMSPGKDKSLGFIPQRTKDGNFKVKFVRWNYPAYYIGLKVNDEIVTINGKKISDVKDKNDLQELLNADEGAMFEIVIKRKGFDKEIKLVGFQGSLNHPDSIGAMLPGKIGYIRTDMFTMSLHTNVAKIIKDLVDKGLRGLIIDFRNNPGGAMNAATGLCDLFLEKDKIITITKGSYENPLGKLAEMLAPGMKGKKIDKETTHYVANKSNPHKFPVVALINELSASASEMTSGCFKSHKRATLVGKTSYGKGVGQTAMPLTSSPEAGGGGLLGMLGGSGMRILYMTCMTYFLPKGEKVHHIGVKPDIEVEINDADAKIFNKLANFRATGFIEKHIRKSAEKMSTYPAFYRSQLIKPWGKLSDYPGSEKLLEIAKEYKFSEQTMLRELRLATQIVLQKDFPNSKESFYNLPDDNQLQIAILQIMKKLNDDSSKYPEYQPFSK